jgi:hypothetical protein
MCRVSVFKSGIAFALQPDTGHSQDLPFLRAVNVFVLTTTVSVENVLIGKLEARLTERDTIHTPETTLLWTFNSKRRDCDARTSVTLDCFAQNANALKQSKQETQK